MAAGSLSSVFFTYLGCSAFFFSLVGRVVLRLEINDQGLRVWMKVRIKNYHLLPLITPYFAFPRGPRYGSSSSSSIFFSFLAFTGWKTGPLLGPDAPSSWKKLTMSSSGSSPSKIFLVLMSASTDLAPVIIYIFCFYSYPNILKAFENNTMVWWNST